MNTRRWPRLALAALAFAVVLWATVHTINLAAAGT